MGRALVGIGALVTLLLSAGPPAAAEIFRWIDDQGVAHYTEGLDSVPDPYRAIAVPLGLRNRPVTAAPAAAPGPEPSRRGVGTVSISYTPGGPILVDGRINGTASVRLLLDTGADRTLINPRALAAAGVSLTRGTREGQIYGVSGRTGATAVVIDSLEIGEARVGRMLVFALDMDMPSSRPAHDGLLGRDFLDQFNVSIDAGRGLVTLSPK